MKLKKIASLALAGIMAVSMLAGCKDGTNPEDPSSSSQVPTASNVVTYANDVLSGSQKEVFTFKGSADLDKILSDVTSDRGTLSSATIESLYDNYGTLIMNGTPGSAPTTIANKVGEKLTNAYISNNFGVPPTNNLKSQKAVVVYTASGALAEKDAVEVVINNYKQYIDVNHFPATISSGHYSCDYEAEISALKVASSENSDKTAWVVAMVFTQNLTSVANA